MPPCPPCRGLDTKLPVADLCELPGKGITGSVAGSAVAVGSARLAAELLGQEGGEGELAGAVVGAMGWQWVHAFSLHGDWVQCRPAGDSQHMELFRLLGTDPLALCGLM